MSHSVSEPCHLSHISLPALADICLANPISEHFSLHPSKKRSHRHIWDLRKATTADLPLDWQTMARSSDSLPTSPLPFGADTHNHNAFRRSFTNLGDPNDQTQQDYSSFIATAQADDARSHRASASIAPSSLKDLPLSHRILLRKHKVLLCVASAIFELSLIALTASIVLCAVQAHNYNANGGGKAAYIIVGVFGFTGMVGSAAVGWFIWRGRKERARLEEKWAADEEMKERRSIRERSRASEVLRSIRERERSLSRSPSKSRGRTTQRVLPALPTAATTQQRPKYNEPIPSFRPMTPTPTTAAEQSLGIEQAEATLDWTNRLDLSESEDEEMRRGRAKLENEWLERELFQHMSRSVTPDTGPPPGLPVNNNDNDNALLGSSPTLLNSSSSPPGAQDHHPPQPQSPRHQYRPTSPTHPPSRQNTTLFNFTSPIPTNLPPPTPPPKSPLPAIPTSPYLPSHRRQHLSSQSDGPNPTPTTQSTSILDFSPLIDPAGGVHPAFRDSGPFAPSPGARSSRLDVGREDGDAVGNARMVNSRDQMANPGSSTQQLQNARPQTMVPAARGMTTAPAVKGHRRNDTAPTVSYLPDSNQITEANHQRKRESAPPNSKSNSTSNSNSNSNFNSGTGTVPPTLSTSTPTLLNSFPQPPTSPPSRPLPRQPPHDNDRTNNNISALYSASTHGIPTNIPTSPPPHRKTATPPSRHQTSTQTSTQLPPPQPPPPTPPPRSPLRMTSRPNFIRAGSAGLGSEQYVYPLFFSPSRPLHILLPSSKPR